MEGKVRALQSFVGTGSSSLPNGAYGRYNVRLTSSEKGKSKRQAVGDGDQPEGGEW